MSAADAEQSSYVDEATGLSVVGGLPREELMPGHHAAASIYLGPEDAAGVGVKIAAVDAAELVGKPLSDLHTHDVDEIYLVITPGLRFDVETDTGTVEVSSPASVRIPAGTPHRFLVRESASAPCVFLGILLGQDA